MSTILTRQNQYVAITGKGKMIKHIVIENSHYTFRDIQVADISINCQTQKIQETTLEMTALRPTSFYSLGESP